MTSQPENLDTKSPKTMKSSTRPNPQALTGESGFSLIELIIGMAVMAEVLVVVLILFDVNNKVSRVQINVADMQQSHRIAQYDVVRNARMAGRGGLPQGAFPGASLAVVVDQNVAANTKIGDGSSPDVMEETDILTLRGSLSMPVYQVRSEDTTTFQTNLATSKGTLIIDSRSPSNIKQGFQDLKDIDSGGGNTGPDAMIIVSATNDALFAVVEITKVAFLAMDVNSDGTQDPDEERVTIDFTWNGAYASEYLSFSGGVFPGLTSVAFAGLLEEYRYYIREDYAIAGDNQSDLMPRLSRARFYPGTDVAYENDAANLSVDIADNIMDLQVAIGIDRDANGVIDENPADTTDDDWLYNDSGDDDTDVRWGGAARLFYLSIATLARTARPDSSYLSERILTIDNRDYNEPIQPSAQAEKILRMHRRRQLRTVVDLRNLG